MTTKKSKPADKRRKDGLIEKVVNGKHFYGKTQTEINRKIYDYREETEKGRPFNKVAEDWYYSAIENITANSVRSYRCNYHKAVEEFGSTPIKTIEKQDVKNYINKLRMQQLARKTIAARLCALRLIFEYAETYKQIDANPTSGVKLPKGLPQTKRNMPPQPEIDKIKKNTEGFALFYYFLLYTGLRRGEALALEWSDIDFKANKISVTKSVYYMGNTPYIKPPKTDNGVRTIPLINCLAAKLKPLKGSGVVFSDNGNGKIYTDKHYEAAVKEYKENTGVTCTAHQLRHAYATMCFEAGLMPKDVQHLLGHSDISTSMNIYTEWRENRIDNAAELLNKKHF